MDAQRIKPQELALILAKASKSPIHETMILSDIEAGAPTNADGTMNLIEYAAWLMRMEHRRVR